MVMTFTLFQERFADLIANANIITKKEVNGKYFNLIFNIFQLCIYFIFAWLILINYRVSKQLNFWIFLTTIYYCILKSNINDNLIFITTTDRDEISCYSDIFLDIGILNIILYFRNLLPDYTWFELWKNSVKKNLHVKREEQKSELQEDLPIDGITPNENDKIANKLLWQLNDLRPLNAFIIGINGEWGNGKTSFLKRLEYKIQFDETRNESVPITFWFNAWQHQDDNSIINNFFNQLKKELSYYSGDAKRSVNNYLNNLLALVDNKYSNGIKTITSEIIGNDLTTRDYYSEINNIISRINRKIIVFVDDLDRLNKNEIIEVIRILRNVANFKNTIFFCGFDKSYVLKTGGFSHNYLDKIFNLEISLPKLPQNGLLIYLIELIQSSSNIKEKENLILNFNSLFDSDTENISFFNFTVDDTPDKRVQENQNNSEYYTISLRPSLFFETRRDVKRFYNGLIIHISILDNLKDVNISEYLIFKLLIFKYSWLLNFFDSKRLHTWLGSDSTLKLNKPKIEFLENSLDIELIDKLTIISVLEKLFPNNDPEDVQFYNSINQKRYLPLYLNNNVFNQAFSTSDLIQALDDLTIEKLIIDKITPSEHSNYLLNDIKSFILKEENLSSLDEFKQAIEIVIKHLLTVNDWEILSFIHLGEQRFKEEFKTMADEIAFNNIDNIFGEFLRNLNLYYTNEMDRALGSATIGEYFHQNKISELEFYNKNHVKQRIIFLFEKLIKTEKSNKEILRTLLDCTELNSRIFELHLFYDEIVSLYKKYLKNNFEQVLINQEPEKVLDFYTVKELASIFADDKGKRIMKESIKISLKDRHSSSSSDLNWKGFIHNGLINFVEYLVTTSKELNIEELAEEHIVYFKAFIRKGLKKPSLAEITI